MGEKFGLKMLILYGYIKIMGVGINIHFAIAVALISNTIIYM